MSAPKVAVQVPGEGTSVLEDPRVRLEIERLHALSIAQRPRMLRAMVRDVARGLGLMVARRRRSARTDARWVRDLSLAFTPEQGRFVYTLARAMGARHAVEFGTSLGVSALYLGAAIRATGDGAMVTSEIVPEKARRAEEAIEAAGLADLVEVRTGDGLETLSRDLPEPIDLVILDGFFYQFVPMIELVEDAIRPGGLVLARTAGGIDYTRRMRAEGSGYLSMPLKIGSPMELSLKL